MIAASDYASTAMHVDHQTGCGSRLSSASHELHCVACGQPETFSITHSAKVGRNNLLLVVIYALTLSSFSIAGLEGIKIMPSPLALHVASDQTEMVYRNRYPQQRSSSSVRISSAIGPDKNRPRYLSWATNPLIIVGFVSEINIPQLDTLLDRLLPLQPGVQLSASSRHRQEPQGLSFRLCVHVMLASTSAKVTLSDRIFVHSGMPTNPRISGCLLRWRCSSA
jgi:hypothetical protein